MAFMPPISDWPGIGIGRRAGGQVRKSPGAIMVAPAVVIWLAIELAGEYARLA